LASFAVGTGASSSRLRPIAFQPDSVISMAEALETIAIPGTNLNPTRIALGTWAIGGWMCGGTDEAESIRTIRSAVDRGINLIDAAPAYGFGRSEEIVGEALAEIGRYKVLIATKVGLDWREDQPFRNASRVRIHKEIEDSLRRLPTDVMDIFQVHWPDPNRPIEETAQAMAELHQAGKIRAIGVSNFSAEQMHAFRAVAPLHTAQPPYILFKREAEKDFLPYCRDNSRNSRVWLLVPRPAERPRQGLQSLYGRRSGPQRSQIPAASAGAILRAVERLDAFARETYGKRVLHLAVRWALDQQPLSTALWRARHPAQLAEVTDVMGWKLDTHALLQIDRIVTHCVRAIR
jgi:aryl-alcohol dehydrogenase-like predicted oxidoreductase